MSGRSFAANRCPHCGKRLVAWSGRVPAREARCDSCRRVWQRENNWPAEVRRRSAWVHDSTGKGRSTRGRSPVWSIVLAGGEGTRLQDLTVQELGRKVPKQYCAFVGTRSLLQHTIHRAARLGDPDHVLAVLPRGQESLALPQLAEVPWTRVVWQPANKDTAAGVLLALTYVRKAEPDATIVLFPCDHFVLPEDRFLRCVHTALGAVERLPDRVVLVGAPADRAELDYGWIVPGQSLGSVHDQGVRAVERFVEKPDADAASALHRSGALWNTLVIAVRAEVLWTLCWQRLPQLMLPFERLLRAIGTPDEVPVLNLIYAVMPERNFSRDLLVAAPDRLAVVPLVNVMWSDWGKAERILQTLREIGKPMALKIPCLDLTGEQRLTPRGLRLRALKAAASS